MSTYEVSYVAAYSAAAALAIVLSVMAWWRRGASAAVPFAALMLDLAFLALTQLLEAASADMGSKTFWAQLQYVSLVSMPLLWLIVALQLTGIRRLVTPANVLLLALVPAATVVLVWTNDHHLLVWQALGQASGAPPAALTKSYGPWFWLHTAYSYLLVVLGALVVVYGALYMPSRYVFQAAAIIVGGVIPFVFNLLYITGAGPFPELDLTAPAYAVCSVVVALSMFRSGFLDVVPAARSMVIECLEDGILVLDRKDRVLDLNPAAARVLHTSPAEAVGLPLADLLVHRPHLLEQVSEQAGTRREIVSRDGDRWYGLRTSPLYDHRHQLIGRVVVISDVTERKRTEEELVYLSTHDMLTGLYNRVYFEEELARLQVGRRFPVSIIVGDVDSLKTINDLYGHAAGDDALKRFAQILRKSLRAEDVVARTGGDEFIILLPSTDHEAASRVVARLRKSLAEHLAEHPVPPLSVSLGYVTAMPGESLAAALKRADRNMYQGKARHRRSASRALYEPEIR